MKRNFNELFSAMNVALNTRKRLAYGLADLLNECGNKGQPVADWELRRTDGSLIDPTMTPKRAKLASGMTLYLSPHAGVGASFELEATDGK